MSLFQRIRTGEIKQDDLLPLQQRESQKPEDWVKITALVIALLSGLVGGVAGMTIAGYFPVAIFGGWEGAWLTVCATGCVACGAGAIFYFRYKHPPA